MVAIGFDDAVSNYIEVNVVTIREHFRQNNSIVAM